MSYRNPEIIVDRSAEILAQGMSNLGQAMVQGVQNIYKQREEQKIALQKQKEAINVFTQNLRGDYTKKISDVASGIKDKSFAEQYIAEQTSFYEGLIDEQARLRFNPGSFSKEQIADLNKRIAKASENDIAAKEFATNVTLDLEIAEDFQFGQSGSEYTFDGDRKGNGMFKNMVFLYANGNKDIPGIEYEKKYKNNMWEIKATVDKENPIVKGMINSGVIDVDALEDVEGKSVLNFSGDPKNYESVFTKIDKGVDLQDAMLSSGIVDKSGKINDNFFEKEYNARTSSVPGKDIITERGVFNEEAIRSNAAFKQNIEKQLLVLNKDNKSQKAWLRSRLNEEPPVNWDEMSTDNKRSLVTNMLVDDTIEKLKGTLKSADGRSFKEKTSLMNRPEPKQQKDLSVTEKKNISNINDGIVVASNIKRDPRLKFDYNSILDLASDYGLQVDSAGSKEEVDEGTYSEIIIKGSGGTKVTILKNDSPDDIAKKIIRAKSPKLGESDLKKVFKEMGKLKPGEGVLKAETNSPVGGFIGSSTTAYNDEKQISEAAAEFA